MEEEEIETAPESETEEEVEERISARPYQVELLQRAKERNTIVCLGTGTGKTFISVMLIKEFAHEVRETYKQGGRRTFFLVNTGTKFSLNKFDSAGRGRGMLAWGSGVGGRVKRWVQRERRFLICSVMFAGSCKMAFALFCLYNLQKTRETMQEPFLILPA